MLKIPQLLSALLALTVGWLPANLHAEDSNYTGEPIYELRPKPESHKDMGHIGPSGILAFVEQPVIMNPNDAATEAVLREDPAPYPSTRSNKGVD